MTAAKKNGREKPDIYSYHDIREFLRDWFSFLKFKQTNFSMRKLALSAGLASSHLPSVMSGKMTITNDLLEKLFPHLEISQADFSFLELLRQLSESAEMDGRIQAYKKIRRFGRYKAPNADSLDAHDYLSKWYYPAVREMVKWPSFKQDPKWIRKKLNNKVTVSEAQEALNFLIRRNYVEFGKSGRLEVKNKQITCAGGVYRLAMAEFHEQILKIATNSIYEVGRNDRDLKSHTFAIPKDKFGDVKEVFSEALEKIKNLNNENLDKDAVYQVNLLAFPLSDIEGGES